MVNLRVGSLNAKGLANDKKRKRLFTGYMENI
jgi:hypothetical protein